MQAAYNRVRRRKQQVEVLKSVNEAGQRLGVKDTTVKKLIREGKLLSVKIGDRRLIEQRNRRVH